MVSWETMFDEVNNGEAKPDRRPKSVARYRCRVGEASVKIRDEVGGLLNRRAVTHLAIF